MATTSLLDMVDLLMAQTGISREQAVVAFNAVVLYMRQHPAEPLHKIFKMLFGQGRDESNHSLN